MRAASLLFACAVAFAEDAVRLEIAPEVAEKAYERWAGIYQDGRKCGWGVERKRLDKQGRIAWEQEWRITSHQDGKRREFRWVWREWFERAAPHRLLAAEQLTCLGANVVRIAIRREGDDFAASIKRGAGKAETKALGPLDYRLADLLAPNLWHAQRRRLDDRLTVRSLEIKEMTVETVTYQVDRIHRFYVGDVFHKEYESRVWYPRNPDPIVLRYDASGLFVRSRAVSGFELRRETKAEALSGIVGDGGYRDSLVTVTPAIRAPRASRRLVLEVIGEGAGAIPTNTRQTVRRTDGKVLLEIGTGPAGRATDEQIEEALESTVRCPAKDPAVARLARKAAGTPVELLRFVHGFVKHDNGVEHPSATSVVADPRGDCNAFALLFTALARANGIPAREVFGLVYIDGAFWAHAWAEVAIDGHWVELDPAFGRMVDATHIRLASSRHLRNATRRLRFRLVSVR